MRLLEETRISYLYEFCSTCITHFSIWSIGVGSLPSNCERDGVYLGMLQT